MSAPTRLNRTIVKILSNPDDTPSRKDRIDIETERLHRLHGISILLSGCELLQLPPTVFSTAAIIFHRYLHRISLKSCNVWSVAMASTLLAAKTEQEPIVLRQIITVYAHLYRRRLWVMLDDPSQFANDNRVLSFPDATSKELEDKKEELQNVPPMMPMGPIWKDWYDAATKTESDILRSLGFTLYWIADEHIHKYLIHFLEAINLDEDASFRQCCWNLGNDCYRLDLCVRYEPEVLACACIYVASLLYKWKLPPQWWCSLCGTVSDVSLSVIGNALLGLIDTQGNTDILVAATAFVQPLEEDAFNGENSFLFATARGVPYARFTS